MRSAPGYSSVEVTNNGREFVSGNDVSSDASLLEFIALRIVDIHPFSGPVTGGTSVTLVGHGFQLGGLGCKFGDHQRIIQAVRMSSYRIRCSAPPYPVTGWVTIEIHSFGGIAESASAFFYQATISTSLTEGDQDAENPRTPASGGTALAPPLGPLRAVRS